MTKTKATPHRKFPIAPTSVNTQHVDGGHVYHFDRVSEAQARQLGLRATPGPRLRMVAKGDGITARRLGDGTLHVVIEWASPHAKEPGFADFMARVLHPIGSDEASE